jgi:hypothetical protein
MITLFGMRESLKDVSKALLLRYSQDHTERPGYNDLSEEPNKKLYF